MFLMSREDRRLLTEMRDAAIVAGAALTTQEDRDRAQRKINENLATLLDKLVR